MKEQVCHPEKVDVLEGGVVDIAYIFEDVSFLVLHIKVSEEVIYLLKIPLPISISKLRRERNEVFKV